MTYQKKYYFTFKSIRNYNYTVEIWQLTGGTITPIEIKGLSNPFSVSYAELSNKLEPIRGSGCQINLLSETDMQFLNLYTSDMQEYQIRFYRSTDLLWCGFLDSEIFEEPFSDITNYPVSFSGNDGFALLDRMYYIDENENHYTGITSQFQILQRIFNKINLPFTYYYIGLSTTITEIGLTDETIFHQTYVMNSNFYNEDGDPETLRTVLNSILQPYGAFITQRNGSIWITDIQSIMDATIAWPYEISLNLYVTTGLTYIGNTSQPVNIGDLSTIKFANSEQQLKIVSGVNKQIVKYSPYKETKLLDFNAEDDNFLYVTTGLTYGSTGFRWEETFYASGNTFDRYTIVRGFYIDMKGLDAINNDVTDSYLKCNNSVNQSYYAPANIGYNQGYTLFKTHLLNTVVANNSNYGIKIDMKVFPRFLNNLNDESETSGKDIKNILLFCDFIIGDKHYEYVDYYNPYFAKHQWVESSNSGFTTLNFYDGTVSSVVPELGNMADKWNSLTKYSYVWNGTDYITEQNSIIIPLNSDLYGDFQFVIYGYSCYSVHESGGIWYHDYEYCGDLRIKDIVLSIVDAKGNEVQELDIEYVGYMNKSFKSEGENIDLIQGSNFNDFPVERGGLIGLSGDGVSYYFIKEWTKNGINDNIENLLLRSYIGNYQNKTLQLNCTTNRIGGNIGFVTYNNYLPEHIFTPIAVDINYEEETSELTLQEIFSDSLTIKKSF